MRSTTTGTAPLRGHGMPGRRGRVRLGSGRVVYFGALTEEISTELAAEGWTDVPSMLLRDLASIGNGMVAVDDGGRVVSVSGVVIDRECRGRSHIAVKPGWRRLGLGRLAIQGLVQVADVHGLEHLLLHHPARDDAVAQQFLTACGLTWQSCVTIGFTEILVVTVPQCAADTGQRSLPA